MHIVAINSASNNLHVANLELLPLDNDASAGCVLLLPAVKLKLRNVSFIITKLTQDAK